MHPVSLIAAAEVVHGGGGGLGMALLAAVPPLSGPDNR